MGVNRVCLPALALLFIALLLLAPALALPESADSSPQSPAASAVQAGESRGAPAGSPPPAITLRPTPLPTRQQNRTTLAQIAKNAADRQKVTIPAFWFLLIVGIAAIGLLAILYLLVRHGAGGTPGRKGRTAPEGGKETIIGPAEAVHAAEQEPNSAPVSAVEFPPSLARKFRNPVFIGQGGLARVFRAENSRTGKIVAVKVPVCYDEVTGTHFTRDMVFWQGLVHENIVQIHSSNILPVPYIEMEYAPSSLAALPIPVPEERAVSLVLAIARGLSYAHAQGVVHRDIKPENILLAEDGTPKVTDWGLGKTIGDSRQSTMIGFSPVYAAPEQIAPHRFGRPGPATDIYQLGMILCELLTGRPAFRGEGIHDLNVAILEEAPVIPSWNGRYERAIRAVIGRCLAKQPMERYMSVDDLIIDLETILKS